MLLQPCPRQPNIYGPYSVTYAFCSPTPINVDEEILLHVVLHSFLRLVIRMSTDRIPLQCAFAIFSADAIQLSDVSNQCPIPQPC